MKEKYEYAIEVTKNLILSANKIPINNKVVFIDIDSIVSTLLNKDLEEELTVGVLVNRIDDMLFNSLRELIKDDKIYVASYRSKASFINKIYPKWQTDKDNLRVEYTKKIGTIYSTYIQVFKHLPNGVIIDTGDIDTFYVPLIFNDIKNISKVPKFIISKDPMALIALEDTDDNFTVNDSRDMHQNLMNNKCKRIVPMENKFIRYYYAFVGHKYHKGVRGFGPKTFFSKLPKLDSEVIHKQADVFTVRYIKDMDNYKKIVEQINNQTETGEE